jgi:hypothetical protein
MLNAITHIKIQSTYVVIIIHQLRIEYFAQRLVCIAVNEYIF